MVISSPLSKLQDQITRCTRCLRLREHCLGIALTKRKSFQNEQYWGKPVAGFGDPHAQLFILGLAPAAHGANRTGRIFTGDRSGEWLYRALHKTDFANQAESHHRDDGLRLKNAYITCLVKCAPPGNKPTSQEILNCLPFLITELSLLRSAKVYLALGQMAYETIWKIFKGEAKKPKFKHGHVIDLGEDRTLILSYHPSQQNTFTGKLTEPMFDSIFSEAKARIESLERA